MNYVLIFETGIKFEGYGAEKMYFNDIESMERKANEVLTDEEGGCIYFAGYCNEEYDFTPTEKIVHYKLERKK
jgi:hypothetical protein